MLWILIFTAISQILVILPAAEETCVSRLEKVNCSNRKSPELLYTCESTPGKNCSCILENPLLSEIGWFKLCHAKSSLKVKKKIIQKRQVGNPNLCGTISPPKPGKVSCTVSRSEIKCIGTCDSEHEFIDSAQNLEYSCQYSDGVWKPGTEFPVCKPICDPPCENGGTCLNVNFCSCSNDFRGDFCQYPITLCGISKNRFASNWKCTHTRAESTCDISCHPPDTPEANTDVSHHSCNIEGVWNPPLPQCVQIPQCREPAMITNGRWQLIIGHIFSVGSRIVYTCENGYLLQGESFLTCNTNVSWSANAPECVQKQAIHICQDPGFIANSDRNGSSTGYPEGASIVFECLPDFVILGDSAIKCLSNGQWSSRKPQCVPSQNVPAFCPKPSAPKNSVVSVAFPNQHPLDTVFNKDIPLSQRLFVINFSTGHNHEFSNISERSFVVGTRVQYKCKNRYYKLYGSQYQTCSSSRTWSGYQAACVPECGRSDSPKTPFVVNGNSTQIGQWPWQVALTLRTHRGLQLICGGVLISELWVLTAAHCATKKMSNIPLDMSELLVFTGKYYRSFEKDDEYIQVKQVRQIIIHDEYDFVHFDGDIALLQLESAVELTTRVQPICLPTDDTTRENIRDGKKGIVIGWGLTEDGKYSDELKETTLPVVGHDRCEEAYREGLRSVTITKNMFCAGHDTGQTDTCSGDSGGPFMFAIGPANDVRWYLEGLVSWGSESGCGTALRYSGFTKVGQFVPWINMII